MTTAPSGVPPWQPLTRGHGALACMCQGVWVTGGLWRRAAHCCLPLVTCPFLPSLQLFLFPGESDQNEATLYHQKHTVMTLLASFLYSAHLPERLAPGRFDYIGEWLMPVASGRVVDHRTSSCKGQAVREGEQD